MTNWLSEYTSRGWVPIAIQPKGKRPKHGGWPSLTTNDVGLIEPDDNVGLILGPSSGGLVDVDLDCREAVMVASRFMPPTLRSGRASSRDSHWWYVSPDAPYVKYDDPLRVAMGEADRSTILEVRSGSGKQTVVAPSIHETGEHIRWENWGTDPAPLTSSTLNNHATVLAAVALLGRYWPRRGNRHAAALALAGVLCRYPLLRSGPLVDMVAAIAGLGYDDEVEDRVQAARDTLRNWGRRDTTGVPRLKDAYGTHRAAVDTAVEWLDTCFERDVEDTEEEQEQEADGVFVPLDLALLMEQGVPETDWLLPGLLVRGKLQFIAGPAGSGKSLLALWSAREVIRSGGTVMYIDEENDPVDIVARLFALGFTQEEASCITYYSYPSVLVTDANMMRAVERATRDHDLVIVDSFWDLMATAGWDPNSHHEVGITMKQVERLKRGGATVLVLDHVSKTNAKTLVGAGVKNASAHAAHTVHVNASWDLTQGGNGKLHRVKGRGGEFAPGQPFTVAVDPRAGTVDFLWPDL